MNQEELQTFLEREYGLVPHSRDRFVASAKVSAEARIAEGVCLGRGVTVHEGVEIAAGVQIGDRVTLRNCRIGPGVRIEDNCIIGYQTLTGGFTHKFEERKVVHPTVIGEETLVRTGTVIYASVTIGDHCWINHLVVLREHTNIGSHTCIGTMTDSEGYNSIGSHVLIHSQNALTARLRIEDYVFVAPMTVFANGNPMNYARPQISSEEQGGVVRFGAQIAVNVVVMPRVEIGYEAVIGPSSVVSRNIPSLSMAMGTPARVLSKIAPDQRIPVEIRRRYYGGAEDPPGSPTL